MSKRKKRPYGLHYVRKSEISPYFIGYRREHKPISDYHCPFRLCCSLLGGRLPPAEGVPPGVFHGFMGSRPPAVRSKCATGALHERHRCPPSPHPVRRGLRQPGRLGPGRLRAPDAARHSQSVRRVRLPALPVAGPFLHGARQGLVLI